MSIRVLKKRAREKEAEAIKKHSHLRARPVLAALSLPEDVSEDGVRVILLGAGRALVENMLGVAQIGREEIRLIARGGILTLQGEELALSDVREGALAVNGRIRAVLMPEQSAEERHD